MMVVRLAIAVPAMMAIMRGCLVGRLRLNRTRTILRSRLQGGSLLHGDKKRQQEESNESLHGNSPTKNPREDIESQVEDKVSANCFRDCQLGPAARETS